MVGKMKSVLVKHPKDAFINNDNVKKQWKNLNYLGCPDFEKANKEYETFIKILEESSIEVFCLPKDDRTGLDSIYTHDPIMITDHGAILCNMGKQLREGEPFAAGDYLEELDIPILGSISGEGRLEGGDVVFLDEQTILVGRGYRTNDEGIRQLRQLLGAKVETILEVPLPHWDGPESVLHLLSIISPIDHDLALVYSRLLPVPFREFLISKGITLLEVPDSEFDSMGCNVLALAPRKCLMLSGNPQTKVILEEAGAEVYEFNGEEISRKGCGGPTCLTRPIFRE